MTHATDFDLELFPVQTEIVLRSTHYRLENLTVNTFTAAQAAFESLQLLDR